MRTLLLLALLVALNAHAQTRIEIFADGQVITPPVPNTQVTVFDLSLPSKLDDQAPDFPADPAIAQAQAQTWLASPAGQQHIAVLKAAYAGQQKLMAYGIQKIPAIAFDGGKYVIYGSLDLAQAVRDYDDYIRRHPVTEGGRHEAAP